jgi:Fe-Mn family superoxide dismutase
MNKTSYQLPKLPYSFSSLEPVISAEILELHYTKHHQAYVNNFNAALDQYHDAEEKKDLTAMLALESTISFNGGGHQNHSLFWECLSPAKSALHATFDAAVKKNFGSMDKLKEKFLAQAAPVQGSGWAWLGYSPAQDALRIVTTQNHLGISSMGLLPLMIVDVWEHAYYLQYQNRRPDYLKALWDILDWAKISKRYLTASAS